MDTSGHDSITVLVVDDHPPFAEGLARLLADQDDLKLVGVARDGVEAVILAGKARPDVVVMDISMPRMNGIEATRRIKSEMPQTVVLALSAYAYESYALAALEAGAGGYLLKNVPMRELVNAIRALRCGETVLDQALAARVLRTITRRGRGSAAGGRPDSRELELLKLGACGLSNRVIAARLLTSERTVQADFSGIFGKLGVASRLEAVVKAIKEGWIAVDDLPDLSRPRREGLPR